MAGVALDWGSLNPADFKSLTNKTGWRHVTVQNDKKKRKKPFIAIKARGGKVRTWLILPLF